VPFKYKKVNAVWAQWQGTVEEVTAEVENRHEESTQTTVERDRRQKRVIKESGQ
jgi:hypothetical protein